MRGIWTLYIDQYGNKWGASTIAELRAKIGGGRVAKMYRDKRDGAAVHCGYVIGRHWCTAYQPVELAA
jgi:hypothetical protein